MALKMQYQHPSGLTAAAAYFRIVVNHRDIEHKEVTLGIYIYPSEANRRAGKPFLDQFSESVKNHPADGLNPARNDYDTYFSATALQAAGMNPEKAGYLYLKAQPKYAAAEDVLA